MQIEDLDTLQKGLIEDHEANKQQLRQVENEDEVNEFINNAINKFNKFHTLLYHIELYNPHIDDESFQNKLKAIYQDFNRLGPEMIDLIEDKKNVLLNKRLSLERIQQFQQFEADDSYVGDQCQVCLEEVEVGKLMKQLDCGGRHSFCSGCIDQWFANHKTCPICRHVFM